MRIKRISLRTHLLLLYVLLAVLSGVIVPLVGVRVTLSEFMGYLHERKNYDVGELAETLISLYQEDGRWDDRRVRDVLRQMSKAPIMALYDAEENKIFPWEGLGRYIVHDLDSIELKGAVDFPAPPDAPSRDIRLDDSVNRLNLLSHGKYIGSMVLVTPSFSGRSEMKFAARLRETTLAGAVLMIVLACVLGFFVAGGLSRPVLKAAERARRISQGDYEASPDKPSGIREMDALSDSVAELGRSLAGQESLRKRLMTDVAHELRTPLTVVKSQVEAFADG
ncbi:MAG: hypothetical protein LBL51_04550, partial [Synergistaceae bacterium]|nr:hypothetical protein [Synergistaceae bacterium]